MTRPCTSLDPSMHVLRRAAFRPAAPTALWFGFVQISGFCCAAYNTCDANKRRLVDPDAHPFYSVNIHTSVSTARSDSTCCPWLFFRSLHLVWPAAAGLVNTVTTSHLTQPTHPPTNQPTNQSTRPARGPERQRVGRAPGGADVRGRAADGGLEHQRRPCSGPYHPAEPHHPCPQALWCTSSPQPLWCTSAVTVL